MKLETRVFELNSGKYKSITELAQAMGISMSQIYRVRQGKRKVNEGFIIGAIKAFPGYKLDDLFYVVPEASQDADNRSELGKILKKDQIAGLVSSHPDMVYREIGGMFGLSRQRVHEIAKEAGLKRDNKPRRYRRDITLERVLELYRRNLLVKDIAQTLSCDVRTIRRRLRAAGISKSEDYSRSRKLDWGRRNSKIGLAAG